MWPVLQFLTLLLSLGNLMAMAFPLFTPQMFAEVTYKWGCTIFACIALLMVPIPYVRVYLLSPFSPS